MAKAILILIAAVSAIAVFMLTKKLNDGERQLRQGRQKLAKNDNLFVQTFFRSRLENGRRQISEGEKKLALWKAVRILLVLACIGFAVAALAKLAN